jgi:MFS family permease
MAASARALGKSILGTTDPRALSVQLVFFAQAFVFASWLARLPAIKIAFDLSEGEIGAILMALPAGAVVSAPVAGMASVFISLRALNILSLVIMVCAVALIGIAPGPILLAAVLFVVGFGAGAVGVAMNSAGIAAEEAVGRPVLLRCHAMFSVGLATGALASSAFVAGGLSAAAHLATVAACAFAAVVCVASWLPGTKPESDGQEPRFAWPSGAVVLPACIACGSMLAEGATMDWSAIYLSDVLEASPSLASLGVAVFAGAMAVVRFFGDGLTQRMGDRAVMLTGAGLGAIGYLIVVIATNYQIALAGYFLVGLGLAPIVPTALRVAGRLSPHAPGIGVAAASSFATIGFLLGPALIGFIAEVSGLRTAFALVCIALIVIACLARMTPSH